ncbi:MAG: hypothetical protein WC866_02395 [Patescibacteria group bacterium]|jgi:hypothetical protein
MPQLTRTQKQLIVLGVLVAAILVLIAVFMFKPPSISKAPTYIAPKIETKIPNDLLERPEYRLLELRVELPVAPGRMGRDNPFEPY